MAPIHKKRKDAPTNESFVRAKGYPAGDDRPSKRFRQDEKTGSDVTSKVPSVPMISRVKDEGKAFPRGGASVLTPLEHKQIQIEATRDVLFEQEGAKASANRGEINDAALLKNLRSKGQSRKGTEVSLPAEDMVRIEGLSYKVHTPLELSSPQQLMRVAYCPWILDSRASLSNKCPRYCSLFTE